MKRAELEKVVLGATFEEDGRRKLSCPDAFKLAEQHGVELLDIAGVCNRENIRLCKCQLGCFK
ncbi:hypothetical protein ACFLQU_02285 [Verrucomicrobiota bacterium]